MKVNIKGALLSGFVLPGLGQLVAGRRVKGMVIVGIVNVFLLAALATVFKVLGGIYLTGKLGKSPNAALILERIKNDTPWGKPLLFLFAALWLYSVIDALLSEPLPDDEGESV